MIADGRDDDEVAAFIRRNLRIVLLGRAECEKLDSNNVADLRQKMPGDWAFGDCAFRRLTHAGIEWQPYLLDEGLISALELRWPQHMTVL